MQKIKKFNSINKKIISTILSLLIILSFSSCKKSDSQHIDEYPVTVSGVTIQKSPEKVVILSDSLADIILALELENKLIARTDECTQEKLATLPSIGSIQNIDLNKISSYSPDLILADKTIENNLLEKLQTLNIPVICLEPATKRESFITLYQDLGSILAGAQTGKTLGENTANNILMTLDDINRIIPKKGVVTTACYFYDNNKKIASGDTLASMLLELSGATNIAKGSTNFNIDITALKISNPNFIFCAENTKNDLLADSTISSLQAAQNGKTFEMDKSLMTRQGHTVVDAVTFMASKMYPEIATSNSSKSDNNETSSKQEGTSQTESNSTESIAEKTYENIQISNGDVSDDVLKVENRLDELNFMPTKPDNVFNEYTVRAITDFQYINGLNATGEANKETLELLFSDHAKTREEPSRVK